jgi:DNA repair protein RadC
VGFRACWPSADPSATGQFRPSKTEDEHELKASLHRRREHPPTGFRAATLDEIMAGARHALSLRIRKGTVFDSPKATADYLTARLAQRDHEVFTLIYLDTRSRLIACQDLFRGTIDGASVHPREVVKEALRHNAAAVILAHFVARHRMRIMSPLSFCAQILEVFVLGENSLRRSHITKTYCVA